MTETNDDLMTTDPFTVLDIDEEADDETIRRRYLALVRQHPPERDPERFRAVRAAYEAIRGRRDRLRVRLLTLHGAALLHLKRACLEPAGDAPGRPGRTTVQALLREGADRIWADRVLSDAKR